MQSEFNILAIEVSSLFFLLVQFVAERIMIMTKTNLSKQFDQRLEAFKKFKTWSILWNYVVACLGGDGWQTAWSLGWRP